LHSIGATNSLSWLFVMFLFRVAFPSRRKQAESRRVFLFYSLVFLLLRRRSETSSGKIKDFLNCRP
jgi:hypothetical protein